MAIAEYASSRFETNSGTTEDISWSKDWFSPDLRNTASLFIAIIVVGGNLTITKPSGWTRIGTDAAIDGIVETSGSITFPGGLTMGAFYCYEPWGSNSSHKWSWPTATYAVSVVGFSGVSAIGTITSDFGSNASSNNTLIAPQGFSAGQAGDLVLTVGCTRVGVSSSGTTYGVGAWTGGAGATPTVNYNSTFTGKSLALRSAGALQTSAGQGVGGATAVFTGHAGAAQPKLWLAKTLILRSAANATRHSFVNV
jgi:hypothetical protein